MCLIIDLVVLLIVLVKSLRIDFSIPVHRDECSASVAKLEKSN